MTGTSKLTNAPDASLPAPTHRRPPPSSAPRLAWAHWLRHPAEPAAAAAELASEDEAVSWSAAAAAALESRERRRTLADASPASVAAAELASLNQVVHSSDAAATAAAVAEQARWVGPRARQRTAAHAAAAAAATDAMIMAETAASAGLHRWTCLVCRLGCYRRVM